MESFTDSIRDRLNGSKELYPIKSFDASEIGQEQLVSYLLRTRERKHHQHFSKLMTQLLHYGFESQAEFTMDFDNGWQITASAIQQYNKENKLIGFFLPVVLSTNRIIELLKSDKSHPLKMQLSIIKLLSDESVDHTPGSELKYAIIVVDRLSTDYKQLPTKPFNIIELNSEDLYSHEEITNILTGYTNTLENHLDTGKLPSKCKNIKWHRQKGKNINMTCTHYCPVSNACKHKNSYQRTSSTVKNLIF